MWISASTFEFACYTAAMTDAASHSAPQHDTGEVRHTLSVSEVGARLAAAGVPRSRRTVIRFCETGMLDAVKVPGPTGPQWFVSPASISKAVNDLKMWDELRSGHSVSRQALASFVTLDPSPKIETDAASHSSLQPAVAESEIQQDASETKLATARHSTSDIDIFEHPYVKRLELQIEKLETKYEAQVRRTEDIQLKAQERLVELQRMTTIGQSKTLADFMLQAKQWFVGGATEIEAGEEPANS
jgi:hypothetical protein